MTKPIQSLLWIGFFSILWSQETSTHQEQSEKYKNKSVPPIEIVDTRTGLDILLSEKENLLIGKRIALVTNHTGVDNNGIPNYKRIMEIRGVDLKIIFSPEHGLFGEAAAGEKVHYEGKEIHFPKVISLYGKSRKPDPELLNGLDWVIYDIQDVGVRFYTYISTLGLVMESAAEAGVPVMVLDRPNPIRGDKIGGPVLNLEFQSFVGFYPIPIRYGLTVGELAKMIAGERWIHHIPELEIIKMKGWERNRWFNETSIVWTNPSPNIPTLETAIVYPGTCLLEATNLSEGRGTKKPFIWMGSPWIDGKKLSAFLNKRNLPGAVFKPITFTPVAKVGVAANPKFKGEICSGIEIVIMNKNEYQSVRTGVELLQSVNKLFPGKLEIRESSMNKLWGNTELSSHLNDGDKIIIEKENSEFLQLSSKYFLY